MIATNTFRTINATELDGRPTEISVVIDRADPMGGGSPCEDCVLFGSVCTRLGRSYMEQGYPYPDGYTYRRRAESNRR